MAYVGIGYVTCLLIKPPKCQRMGTHTLSKTDPPPPPPSLFLSFSLFSLSLGFQACSSRPGLVAAPRLPNAKYFAWEVGEGGNMLWYLHTEENYVLWYLHTQQT